MKKRKGKNLFALVLLSLLVLSLLTSAATPPAALGQTPPAPEQSGTPAPEQSDTPAPEQSDAPAPEQSDAPAPEQSGTPAPEQSGTPAPEQSDAPAPEQSDAPAPDASLLLPAPAALKLLLAQAEPEPVFQLRTAPVMMTAGDERNHESYMSGTEGMFFPDQAVTRLELALSLAEIVDEFPDRVAVLYDVPRDTAGISAIQRTVGLGLLTAPNGYFRPNDPVTHAECALALSRLLPYSAVQTKSFSDVAPEHWAYDAISRGGGYGLFSGDEEGNFAPEEELKRWEQAAAFNRLLGRGADRAFVSQLPVFDYFSDVPAEHPGYWDVMEAALPHAGVQGDSGESWLWADVHMLSEDGPIRISGRLYWIQDGAFVRDRSVGLLYFDAYGRYTTGSAELDTRLNNIIERLTDSTMTRDQKLRVLFNYCRDYYTYLKRPLISKGQTGWEPDYALFFLRNGKGNCYCFSAAYCLLCRNLGLPAYTVVGRALNSPHGWVEIELDGTVYLFDTQLEWRYLHDWGMRGYNFFKQPIYSTTVAYTR